MINQQAIEGHWTAIKGQIQETWGQINENELQQVKGNINQLIGLIERKSGEARAQVEAKLDQFLDHTSNLTSRSAAAARDFAESAGTQAQEAYDQASATLREGYNQAEEIVQQRPMESVAVAFGTGLVAGVIVGLVFRSR